MAEIRPQHLRDREGPQTVTGVLEHLLGQERAEQRSTLGGARGTEPPSLAGEGDQILGATLLAADPSEAVIVDAAVEEGEDRIFDRAAPEAVASLEALLGP